MNLSSGISQQARDVLLWKRAIPFEGPWGDLTFSTVRDPAELCTLVPVWVVVGRGGHAESHYAFKVPLSSDKTEGGLNFHEKP